MANNSQSILRRLRELYNSPGASLEQLTDTLKNFNRGEVAEIRPSGAGMRKLSRDERVRQMTQGALDNLGGGGMGALGIIKNKGGNWLTGSVEDALSGLWRGRSRDLPGVDTFEILSDGRRIGPKGNVFSKEEVNRMLGDQALNNWIEGPLTKYVKRDMATEGDPVRKLAEQGVLHYQPTPLEGMATLNALKRSRAGQLAGGISEVPLARNWEQVSDWAITHQTAKERMRHFGETNPWLEKLNPEESVYHFNNPTEGLGFKHLTDELANALNPESGLPRQLLLTPEQTQQMGMEKAVRHVADINAWRAAQQAEANLAKSQSPAVHMVREYAENNPKGLRWVELRQGDLPEGWVEDMTGVGKMKGYTDPEGKFTIHDPRRQLLADQLKYEGDTMGHCVGGYCDEVAGGRSRIFSLRDAKGEPHVTIETGSPRNIDDQGIPDKYMDEALDMLGGDRPGLDPEEVDKLARELFQMENPSVSNIVQIKGKQNLKPKDEYLPFVQDFVRNHPEGGKWGDIGDLGNTGLRRARDVWNDMEQERIRASGKEFSDYVLPTDIEEINQAVWPKQNFAEGGLVRENYRPLEFDGVRGYILQ